MKILISNFSIESVRAGAFRRSPTPSDWAPSDEQPAFGEQEPDQDDLVQQDGPVEDLEENPLFIAIDELLDQVPDEPDFDWVDDQEAPPAFYEDPIIRNIYLRVFLDAAFNHATEESVKCQLRAHYEALKSCQARARDEGDGLRLPGLEKMAKTLRTVERRLGIDPNKYIVYYFVCDVCWDRHHPSELKDLQSTLCQKPGCQGQLFEVKQLSKGTKRVPKKVLATCPIIPQIQRILLRPGKFEDFQHWRGDDDEPRECSPDGRTGLDAFEDVNRPLRDIHDGWAWRAAQAGLARRRGGAWGMEDVDAAQLNQRFVLLPNGLLAMLNIDWYVLQYGFVQSLNLSIRFTPMKSGSFCGKYSCGAMYLTILNNPRTKRFLREETILVCVIPGPTEPSLEQLNAVIEPFVQEMLILGSGMSYIAKPSADLKYYTTGLEFKVHGQPERVLTHMQLLLNSSDLPASRKITGLRSCTSKYFMCPWCLQTVPSLTHEDCFTPDSTYARTSQMSLTILTS